MKNDRHNLTKIIEQIEIDLKPIVAQLRAEIENERKRSKPKIDRRNIGTQTEEENLIFDLEKLKLDVSIDEKRKSSPISVEKVQHRSACRTFRKLTSGLKYVENKVPFQVHLSKYHKHEH